MQQHYGLDAEDIFSMSWRRFAVLFNGIFSWSGEDEVASALAGSVPTRSGVPTDMSKYKQAVHEARGADSSISRSLDWDAALGKTPADTKSFSTTKDLMGGI